MTTAKNVLKIAAGEIGYSRWNDPEQGTKYGRWYAQKTKQTYYAANGVPYCAMFVSWVLDKAGGQVTGFPNAYCPSILQTARNANLTLSNKKNAQAGDIVLFNWDGGVVDHVGIVEANKGSYIQTIEGNTSNGAKGSQGNGGLVARRTRAWSVVAAIIRPRYNGADVAKNATSQKGALAVDGILGVKSVSAWQRIAGTPIDGLISGQKHEYKQYYPALTAVLFDGGGSQAVKALQKQLKINTDGILGGITIEAWQTKLKVNPDKILGKQTAKAIQTALNKNKLY